MNWETLANTLVNDSKLDKLYSSRTVDGNTITLQGKFTLTLTLNEDGTVTSTTTMIFVGPTVYDNVNQAAMEMGYTK